jgi:plasmid stabilization system protein ParE
VRHYTVRLTEEAHADLQRLYDFLVGKDLRATAKALKAIRHSIKLLSLSPYACRKAAADMPRLRELLIPFDASGYVVMFEIEPPGTVTILAARHQREDDYQ